MSVLINFRIDEKLKSNMDKVCKDLGITMSAAFNMFAKDLVSTKNINFSLNKKMDSGINMKNLYKKLGNDDTLSIDNKEESTVENLDKYYINRIGNIIMLVPKDDEWMGIRESAGTMSEDFLTERNQSANSVREEL